MKSLVLEIARRHPSPPLSGADKENTPGRVIRTSRRRYGYGRLRHKIYERHQAFFLASKLLDDKPNNVILVPGRPQNEHNGKITLSRHAAFESTRLFAQSTPLNTIDPKV
jgi:hypothetical protein